MQLNKFITIRISEEVLNAAWQSIKYRANKSYGRKPENLSSFLRSIVLEEWDRNKKELTEIIDKT